MSDNIVEVLRSYTDAHPDAPALISGKASRPKVTTFGEIDRMSAHWAAILRSKGVGVGDRVLILQPISVALYAALLATFRVGATVVFPDPQALSETIALACERLKPKAMIGGWPAHLLRLFSRSLRGIPCTFSTAGFIPGAIRLSKAPAKIAGAIAAVPADHTALVTLTSGSTGVPKMIGRSHGLLRAQHAAITRAVPFTPGSMTLTALPVFVLSHIASGVTSVLPASDVRRPREIDPEPLFQQIDRHRIDTILASPALVEQLATAALERKRPLASLKHVLTGGGPIFGDLVERARHAMPNATIHLAYGSSEAEPIAHIAHSEISQADTVVGEKGAGLLAGKPTPGTDVAIIRDHWGATVGPLTPTQFAALKLPAGETGEIVVAGDHVLPAYADGVGDAETKINVGGRIWHRTGDAGAFDSSGRIWLRGRCAARLNGTRGVLYPLQVEAMARAKLGPIPIAAVQVGGEACLVVGRGVGDAKTLEALAHDAGCHRAVIVDEVPLDRRHQSKIDYPALAKLLSRDQKIAVRR
jgi:acyl-CoA synthetase (AMP-forming)/AMP-acid ligase II